MIQGTQGHGLCDTWARVSAGKRIISQGYPLRAITISSHSLPALNTRIFVSCWKVRIQGYAKAASNPPCRQEDEDNRVPAKACFSCARQARSQLKKGRRASHEPNRAPIGEALLHPCLGIGFPLLPTEVVRAERVPVAFFRSVQENQLFSLLWPLHPRDLQLNVQSVLLILVSLP